MTIYKAEVFVELEYDTLCSGCFFYSGGGGFTNMCELTKDEWESETCDRPVWCPLKEVKVL